MIKKVKLNNKTIISFNKKEDYKREMINCIFNGSMDKIFYHGDINDFIVKRYTKVLYGERKKYPPLEKKLNDFKELKDKLYQYVIVKSNRFENDI